MDKGQWKINNFKKHQLTITNLINFKNQSTNDKYTKIPFNFNNLIT